MAVEVGEAQQHDPLTEPFVAAMPPVNPDDYYSPSVRAALRREREERRTRYRSLWWFPLLVAAIAMSGSWALLKADQLIAENLIWPSQGVQFVEVGPAPADPASTGRPIMIVVGGLNRKSGTGPAQALLPALSANGTRVFSLVYGSGISDQDILDKFDGLLAEFAPREVSFFGSSMGGDVVLNLAAHAQTRRDDYREQLLDAAVPFGPGLIGGVPASRHPAVAPDQAGTTDEGGSTDRAGAATGGSTADQGGSTDRAGAATDTAAAQINQPEPAGQQLAVGAIVVDLAGSANNDDAPPRDNDPSVQDAGTDRGEPVPAPPPTLGTIYLDCSPLDATDVRNPSRTSADALTALTEALHTDGGVLTRLTAEVLAQQSEWSTGRFPFVDIDRADLIFKIRQVWHDKISNTGISTQLVKDQYGVIRRMQVDDVMAALAPGTRIVYFLPENRADDRTIRVRHVEERLVALSADNRLDLRVVSIPGGHHASAESNPGPYLAAMADLEDGKS